MVNVPTEVETMVVPRDDGAISPTRTLLLTLGLRVVCGTVVPLATIRTAIVLLSGNGPEGGDGVVVSALATYALAGESADMRCVLARTGSAGVRAEKWAVRAFPKAACGGVLSGGTISAFG